jgi:hypothetical protein
MRELLWAWIVGFTALVLFMPPMLEKQRTLQGEAVQWSNKSAFERSVLGNSWDRETRVDISRLIITLLAINFVPAVALWRYNAIREWLQCHKSELERLGVFLVSMMVVIVLKESASRFMRDRSAHQAPARGPLAHLLLQRKTPPKCGLQKILISPQNGSTWMIQLLHRFAAQFLSRNEAPL